MRQLSDYKAADFFISASTSETQGLTYLESIASGTPIIAHGNPYLNHVIDDPMFGKLFYEESDLAQAIFEAIDEMPAIDETKWAEKIDDISAATFGRRVYEFYLDKIISKDFSNDLNPEQSRVKRMSKTIVKIPTKVIALPVNGSVKMMKASVKQVKKIRKITHFLIEMKLFLDKFFNRVIITDRDISNLGNLIESAWGWNRVEDRFGTTRDSFMQT